MSAPIRIAAAIIPSVETHTLHLARTVTIGEAAAHLSGMIRAADDPAHTLEWAHPVMPAHRLDEIDIGGGDRLLIVLRPPIIAPQTSFPGAAILQISGNGQSYRSTGKTRLIFGKADPARSLYPEIDAGQFVPPVHIDYLSRTCALFEFTNGTWRVSKGGVTRVVIDDYEVGAEPVPLQGLHQLRLYRAGDDPSRSADPMAVLTLRAENNAQANTKAPAISGDLPVIVGVGYERVEGRINADAGVSAADLTARIAQFHGIALTPETEVYRVRLLSPSVTVGSIRLGSDGFLYYPAPALASPLTTRVE